MAKVKFIHTSDLHLDTPFKGLTIWNAELAGRLRDATFQSFRKTVDLCITHQVDFLLISGDIFDSQIQSLAAQLRFVSELTRLSEKGIWTYFICGNHDPLSSWLENLHLPEKVVRFGSDSVEICSFKKEGRELADIHGISYSIKEVRENLSGKYHLSDTKAPFSIALLHGSIGATGAHENYAPFSLDDVRQKGFDYWALGHIHKRQIVHNASPTIAYSGNPQGRDFGETGVKGCLLVEMEENLVPEITLLPTHQIRFEEVSLDLSGEDGIDTIPLGISDAISKAEDYDEESSYIVRVQIYGRTSMHEILHRPGEMDQLAVRLNEGQIHQANFTLIDRIELNTRPDADLEIIRQGSDFPAEILRSIEEFEGNTEILSELITRVDKGFNSHAARQELLEFSEEDNLEILEKAKWLLMDYLLNDDE